MQEKSNIKPGIGLREQITNSKKTYDEFYKEFSMEILEDFINKLSTKSIDNEK